LFTAGVDTAGQDALRQPALALLELQSQVRALSIIGSRRRQSIPAPKIALQAPFTRPRLRLALHPF